MNERGPIDWTVVFSRAHRRIAIQLAIVAALGAAGAAVILGGGAATKAAVERADKPAPPSDATEDEADLTLEALPSSPSSPPSEEEDEEEGEAEGEEGAGEGEGVVTFVVRNETELDADEFVVVAQEEERPFESLAAGEQVKGTFPCTPGEEVTLAIDAQAYNGAQITTCGEAEEGNDDGEEDGPETPGTPTPDETDEPAPPGDEPEVEPEFG